MEQNNPDFIIQPAKDLHTTKEGGIRGGEVPPNTLGITPQHTITLTLTSPGPSSVHGQGPGPSGPGPGPSLIVSGLGGLGSGSAPTAASGHSQVGMHYTGTAISATPLPSQPNKQGTPPSNYVMSGGVGASVLPSAAQGLAGLSAVSSTHGSSHGQHYSGPAITGTPIIQTPKGGTGHNYGQTGNPGGQDSGDEGGQVHGSSNPSGHETGSATPAESHQSGPQTEQRLKVEDALNYLDQVKYKFGNQPQVYNDFLDIMKEFKSQSIDTPGVIARVSNLFRGSPELIVGFNTFLPPGYKIEVQTSEQFPQFSKISYRVDGVTSYVVSSSLPPGMPSSMLSNVPQPQSSSSSSQVIQHTPGGPAEGQNSGMRSGNVNHVNTVSGPPPSLTPAYGGMNSGSGGSVSGAISNLGGISNVTNGRNVSPVSSPAPNNLASSANNSFESSASSGFHHSLASPFVQNQFPSLQTQPVEFNHAINYVNKIKNRFHGQPDKYKQFLEILHTYQKEQRNVKNGYPPSANSLTEHEVYSQVAKLFENQEDLLQEFGQFLPDATNPAAVDIKPVVEPPKKPVKTVVSTARDTNVTVQPTAASRPHQLAPKRSTAAPAHQAPKKPKLSAPYMDITFAEASRYGTLHDYSFFDKLRSVLKSSEAYENFLKCLSLYNRQILSRAELVMLVKPFFTKAPELFQWFMTFVGGISEDTITPNPDPVPPKLGKLDKLSEEQALEIDFSTCKRLGASYCALPKNHVPPSCGGRTALCKEVLNDVWVSFPTWSEDSTFVTSRKTQYEEYICRCEDERFELDVIIEANAATIRTFEKVARQMARMTPEEVMQFQLDDFLGGDSDTIHQRTVRRLYGDKASDMITGLKQQPYIAIPVVLRRLKNKEEEWRESQKVFNKIWREQVERFYLKSLDHQGISFKQSDIRALRSKSLISEIETIFDERNDQVCLDNEHGSNEQTPHLSLQYRDRVVLDDACNLLLHHVRRQSGIQKEDKRRIKQLLKHFIPDLFNHSRMELSDDENDDGSHDEHEDRKTPTDVPQNGTRNGNKRTTNKRANGKSKKDDDDDRNASCQESSGNNNHGTKSDCQESRRTLAKRELKQTQSDGTKGRRSSENFRDGRNFECPDFRKTVSENMDSQQQDVPEPPPKQAEGGGVPSRTVRIIQVPHLDLDESYTLICVNNSWYVFLRLHQILCERLTRMLETAAKLLLNISKDTLNPADCPAVALGMRPMNEVEVEDYYPTFLEMVRNLLDGNMEANTYEDTLREMFGIHAYIAYTMDKVVANAVRQLQTLVSDEVCQKVLDLFSMAQKKGGAGGLCATVYQRQGAETAYQKQAEKAYGDENCVKVVIYKKSSRMTMQLMETESTEDDHETAKWSAYIDNYNNGSETAMDLIINEKVKAVFLPRNIRKHKKQRMNAYTHFPKELTTDGQVEPKDDGGPERPNILKMPGILPSDPDDPLAQEVRSVACERLPKLTRMDIKPLKAFISQTEVNPVTPQEADELERLLELNSKRRSKSGQKSSETDEEGDEKRAPTIKLGTNEPVTPEEAEQLERKLEYNSKRREIVELPEPSPYVIAENLQCKFNPHSYKMVFVVNSENYFYLKGALKKAKEVHKKVSNRCNEEFGKWHQAWLESNVTEEQITRCEDWLISTKNSDTRIISNNDISLPPYRPFNKYVVSRK